MAITILLWHKRAEIVACLQTVDFDGWWPLLTPAHLVRMYNMAMEEGLFHFAKLVMDLLVLTICNEIDLSTKVEFSDRIAELFGSDILSSNAKDQRFARIHLSLDRAVRGKLREQGHGIFVSLSCRRGSSRAPRKKNAETAVADATQKSMLLHL